LILHILLSVETEILTDVVRLTHISSVVRQLVLCTPGFFSRICLKPSVKSQKTHFNALKTFFDGIQCKDAITAVDLSKNDMIPLEFPLQLIQECPNLESLEINNCRGFEFPAFMNAFRQWTHKKLVEIRKKECEPLALRFLDIDAIGPCFPTLGLNASLEDDEQNSDPSDSENASGQESDEDEVEEGDSQDDESDSPVVDAALDSILQRVEAFQRSEEERVTREEETVAPTTILDGEVVGATEIQVEGDIGRLMVNARHHDYWFSSLEVIALLTELQDLVTQLSGGIQVILKPSVCPACKENTAHPPDIALKCLFCAKSIAWVCDNCEDEAYRICYPCAKKEMAFDTVACVSCATSQSCPECTYWQCMKCTDSKNEGRCEACEEDTPAGQIPRRIR
jgi:hypothetical protein